VSIGCAGVAVAAHHAVEGGGVHWHRGPERFLDR